MSQKRIMGIDFGTKRIGLAISDSECKFAIPNAVLANSPELMTEMQKIIKDNEVGEIVIGESRNYKGEANPVLMETMDFKDQLEKLGYKVHLEPEFMTSMHAERLQGKNNMTDASAAAIILQSYIDKNTKS